MTDPEDPVALLRSLQNLRIAFEAVTERVAKAAGLNPRDLGVLDVLHAEGPQTPTALAERTGIHPATLTAALARLQRSGHVTRHRDPDDGRSWQIVIADDAGWTLAEQYETVNDELLAWLSGIVATNRAIVAQFLDEAITRIGPESHPTPQLLTG